MYVSFGIDDQCVENDNFFVNVSQILSHFHHSVVHYDIILDR